jgi:SAM-dependent methyltransferase
VGNDIVAPHFYYLTSGANFWLYAFAQGWASLDSRVVDIGCGCGKTAATLRDFDYMDARFRGRYYGFDVDAEMVRWCKENFDPEHFTFTALPMFSAVYNPGGRSETGARLEACDTGSIDLVFSQSLFSHLLEKDVCAYVRESARVLRTGGIMVMTFFCMDDLRKLGLLGDRWSFEHRIGNAYVENVRYPEAAVAYERDWMEEVCRSAGFSQVEVRLPAYQSTLVCTK